ncbi:MAG: DUF4352 domain-containing protein [Chloroflexota bacterium]|nr:DUF4352 domain-containing protein [Chloroflexota bacterium]
MKRLQTLRAAFGALIAVCIGLLGLYGCGGDSPTPTVIPTATSLPPTQTPVPPPPSPTTAANPTASSASAGDIKTITDAVNGLKSLKSYHYDLTLNTSEFITQPVKIEGDYVSPNTTSARGNVGNQQVDQFVVGNNTYERNASGKYVKKEKAPTGGDISASLNPQNFASGGDPASGVVSLASAASAYSYVGQETLNGAQTKHYSFKFDMSKMMGTSTGTSNTIAPGMPDIGGGGIWLDPQTGIVSRVGIKIDMGPIMGLMAAAFQGTPTPGLPTPTTLPSMVLDITMNLSKQNDPSIKIDLPADVQAAESAPAATPTAGTISLPTQPEQGPTQAPQATVGGTGATPAAAATMPATPAQQVAIGSPGTVDNLKITVNSVRHETNGLLPPAAGSDYVIVNLTVENPTKDAAVVSSALQFSVVDSTGKSYDISVTPKIDQFDAATKGTIAAGAKATGEAGFEVPTSAKGLKFIYKSFMGSGQISVPLDK